MNLTCMVLDGKRIAYDLIANRQATVSISFTAD